MPPENLSTLKIPYRDYNSHRQIGTLVVNKEIAEETKGLFKKLYDHHFLIEKMIPIDNYGADDDASMADNNTSAFNCRDTTGRPGVFSNHSWGRAIDINPLTNPYVKVTRCYRQQAASIWTAPKSTKDQSCPTATQ